MLDRPSLLFLCDASAIAAEPWLAAGYECWCVDLLHPAGEHREGNLVRVGADVRQWLPPRRDWLLAVAWPPCTDLSVSGARWFPVKGLRRLAMAIDTFGACVERLEWCGCPGFAENPVSVISSHFRKPDFSFDPCEYAGWLSNPSDEAYTKRTNLWAFGGFVMPEKRPVSPVLGSKMHLMAPSADRAARRSQTPRGFAAALFAAYSPVMAESEVA